MRIFIPSTKRTREHEFRRGPLTYMLPSDIVDYQLAYVVPEDEAVEYRNAIEKFYPHPRPVVLPCPVRGIDKTRHWIGELCGMNNIDKFLMLDDDIRFYRRISDDSWHLRDIETDEFFEMIDDVESFLDVYGHVGISAREGNNRLGAKADRDFVVENTRTLRALAYRTKDFLSVEHGRVPVMEDFDVNLQLLEKGIPNCVLVHWAQGQHMTGSAGGCSTYRNHDVQDYAARKLCELHPKIVRLRQKENKSGGEFGIRTEVTIQWKQAFTGV